jgi:IS30 family transposase
VNTVVERTTGFTLITKLSDKTTHATIAALKKRFELLPESLKHTLTLDNGFENGNWRAIEYETGLSCYFAHPYHSWERGTNENTNGLIRDYFPKKTDFTLVSDAEIAYVEYALNTRPRKRLGYLTPLEVWSGALRG